MGDRAHPRRGFRRPDDEERDGHRGADLMYAIGTFAREGEQPFPGLVLDGERVVDLSGYGWRDTNQILNTWATAHAVLDRLTDGSGDISLADVTTLAPLEPNQILQSGANYRKHVTD